MAFNTVKLLGVPVSQASLNEMTNDSITAIESPEMRKQIVASCVNPHSLVEANKNTDFFNALNNAEHSVCDGTGSAIALKMSGCNNIPRITGHDYFTGIMSKANNKNKIKVAFFGSSQKVLNLIHSQIKKDYPNIEIVALISPPFGEWSQEKNAEMISELNAANPDILWVGMTAPKQETWVYQNRSKLNAKVIGNIGAVFDFYAGTKPRAPEWACKLGIEWLHRLIKEPRRLWRRNFVSTPKFLLLYLLNDFLANISLSFKTD